MTDAPGDVSVVVVTWNALPWIERCLESVAGYETIVVDHGSSDGTLELVREKFPAVQVIEQENVGMGGGNNAGMRAAHGRYFFLLNADAWVTRRRARAPRRVRGRASGSGGRRAAAPQPRRDAPALGARRPDLLAARDRVPLPPQARSPLEPAEPALRRRLRPRRDARGRMADGSGAARAARSGGCGGPLRRGLLHVQRGGGLAATASAGRAGRSSSTPAPRSCTSAARRTAARCTSRTSAAICASSPSTAASPTPSGPGCSCSGRFALRALVFRGERGRAYREGARFLAGGKVRDLIS